MKHLFKNTIFFLILWALSFSCAHVKYVPVEHVVSVAVHDTTYLKPDTVKVDVPFEVVREVCPALDTLTMETSIASAWAALDTTTRTLNGGIENKRASISKPVEIPVRVIVRDSLVYRDVPMPVEVEKPVRYVPFLCRLLSLIGGIALAFIAWKYGKKYVLRWIA